MIRAIINGNRFVAERAAWQRGIPIEVYGEGDGRTAITVRDEQQGKMFFWFMEDQDPKREGGCLGFEYCDSIPKNMDTLETIGK